MGDRQWFVLYVLVCLEVGLFLILVPWSAIWERNYFLDTFPDLRPLLLSPVLRGAVCGLGVANLYLGFAEVLNRLRGRDAHHESEGDSPLDNGRAATSSEPSDRGRRTEVLAAPEER